MEMYKRTNVENEVLRLMDKGYPPSRIDEILHKESGFSVDILTWLWLNEKRGSLLR